MFRVNRSVMTTRVTTLPMSISNAYLLQGERPVLIDAGGPGDDERLLPGHGGPLAAQDVSRRLGQIAPAGRG
jgi:hypothetical protein